MTCDQSVPEPLQAIENRLEKDLLVRIRSREISTVDLIEIVLKYPAQSKVIERALLKLDYRAYKDPMAKAFMLGLLNRSENQNL